MIHVAVSSSWNNMERALNPAPDAAFWTLPVPARSDDAYDAFVQRRRAWAAVHGSLCTFAEEPPP
jgi:hypothetical protein